MMSIPQQKPTLGRRGFTLIELLVTITILAVLAVIVIPSVRTLTRDRKVREAARVVGAMFSQAREQAAIDGMAGVEIVPLQNASGNYNVTQMGMRLYRLRNIPPYVGDLADARATVVGTSVVLSANNDLVAAGVMRNDYVEFNNSGVWYRINQDPSGLGPPTGRVMTFDIGDADPPPPNGEPLPFKIRRQPVRVESSVVDMPNRLFINLAFSGHGFPPQPPGTVDQSNNGFQFRYLDPVVSADDTLKIWFGRNGSVDRVRVNGGMVFPQGPIFLLICTGDGDEVDVTDLSQRQYIENDNNLWVVIEPESGNVSVGRMANIDPSSASLPDQVRDARALASNRKSATP